MGYNEFVVRKNADNYLYRVESKFNTKLLKSNMNYPETIEFCKGIENDVVIWLN